MLAEFYGNEAKVAYGGAIYTSPPLIDKDNIKIEWRLFKRAFVHECDLLRRERKTSEEMSLQDA